MSMSGLSYDALSWLVIGSSMAYPEFGLQPVDPEDAHEDQQERQRETEEAAYKGPKR